MIGAMQVPTRQSVAIPASAPGQTRRRILDSLLDGRFHSGEALAASCGVTRAAVWKHIQTLRGHGLDVFAVTGHGYRLAEAFEPLDEPLLRSRLLDAAGAPLRGLELHGVTDSTNSRLLQRLKAGDIHAHACLAEFQRAGRGRRGRNWICPYGAGLCLSLGWRFPRAPESLTALGLVIGLAVVQVLEAEGLAGAGLKWPNDILWRGRKLGGILLELQGQADGPVAVVIGLGLNIRFPAAIRDGLDQPGADLSQALGRIPSRNDLAVGMLRRLAEVLAQFGRHGFAGFHEQWSAYDLLRDRQVRLSSPAGEYAGTARGVDDTGALIIAVDGRRRRFLSGDVSVRMSA